MNGERTLKGIPEAQALAHFMGFTMSAERIAARTFALCAQLDNQNQATFKGFCRSETKNSLRVARTNRATGIGIESNQTGCGLEPLMAQVEDYFHRGQLDSLVLVKGILVDGILMASRRLLWHLHSAGSTAHQAISASLEDKVVQLRWVYGYVRGRFFQRTDDLVYLCHTVTDRCVDAVGLSLMKAARCLDYAGLSGASFVGDLMDGYVSLLEEAAVEQRIATRDAMSIFMPVVHGYRQICSV